MANLDLQKYGKKELIQMIMAKEDEIQKLKVEVQAIKTELENKNIESNTIGSIASAGESVSSIFAEAQRTAEKYISSIEYRKENSKADCLKAENEMRSRCERMVADAQEEADAKWSQISAILNNMIETKHKLSILLDNKQ